MKKGANEVQFPLSFVAEIPMVTEGRNGNVICFNTARANKEVLLMRGQEQDIVANIVSAARRFDW